MVWSGVIKKIQAKAWKSDLLNKAVLLFSIGLSDNLALCLCIDCFGGTWWYSLWLESDTTFATYFVQDIVQSGYLGCFKALCVGTDGWEDQSQTQALVPLELFFAVLRYVTIPGWGSIGENWNNSCLIKLHQRRWLNTVTFQSQKTVHGGSSFLNDGLCVCWKWQVFVYYHAQ